MIDFLEKIKTKILESVNGTVKRQEKSHLNVNKKLREAAFLERFRRMMQSLLMGVHLETLPKFCCTDF